MRIHFVVLKYCQYIRERGENKEKYWKYYYNKINIIVDRNKKSMRIKNFTNKELREKKNDGEYEK